MNDVKLKGKELFFLLMVAIPPLLMFFVPNYAAIYVGIDAWIIFALISVIDVLFAFVILRIGTLAPDKTVIGMCRYAFGEVIGSIFALSFVLLFGYKAMMYFRQGVEYVYLSTYTLEPIYYFAVPMIAINIYAQIKGAKTILRLSNIVFILIAAAYFFLLLSGIRNLDIRRLMPVMVDGPVPILEALPHFFTWSGNVVILLMFFNKADMKTGVSKYVMIGAGISYAIILVLNILYIGMFGIISGFITGSVIELAQYINTHVFFNSFDSVIKLIWILGVFIRDFVFTYCTIDSLAELIKTKNKKMLRILMPVALGIVSLLLFKKEEDYFITAMGPTSYLSGLVEYGAVLLLWIGLIVKKKSKNTQECNNEATT